MAWEREREAFRRQESGGVLFFRVVVMLSCLILVPLAAIFGSAFPDLVQTQLVERLKSMVGMDNPTERPSSEIQPLPAVSVESSGWNTAEPAPAWQPAVSPATSHQADYTADTPLAEAPVKQAAATQVVDHFTEIQQRLRVYGATRYALEAMEGGGSYRFHCTMSISGSPQGKDFQAVNQDPLQAMADVLNQVEAWRAEDSQKYPTSARFRSLTLARLRSGMQVRRLQVALLTCDSDLACGLCDFPRTTPGDVVRLAAGRCWESRDENRDFGGGSPQMAFLTEPQAAIPGWRRTETVLFVSREPISSRKLAHFAGLLDGTEARTLVRRLNRLYDAEGAAFRVEEVAGGYQLMTRAKFGTWLRRLFQTPVETRLSGPALETLAVVAYRQPVLRANVDAVRGVDCGEILRQLMERDLVRIVGRSDDLGRPYLYGTTKRFLQIFGLKHLEDLPRADILRALPIPAEAPLDRPLVDSTETFVAASEVNEPLEQV